MLPVLPTVELKVIASPTSPTVVVEPTLLDIVTSPTSVVASVLVSMRTPPRSPGIPHICSSQCFYYSFHSYVSETGKSFIFKGCSFTGSS